ncbi:hypothetical protein ASPVEDRAFT_29373 [Aspergillus versicolor CBS 583.65]|uniref:Uncharacterized protein n=1 Tax=Aspergillus versicolor CBS 583.65 TaxID=1036611 RepID=A0A1L9PMZ5_ASPVE|nr:uncharacterized protein ASPVEDRAFT_29373 [Aspergillus versicolor CBS 583.65]OJJ02826.1 hypothetical protein ASPVEDRAFT_29373 [Aspergillus versicolor CBS 583.65]
MTDRYSNTRYSRFHNIDNYDDDDDIINLNLSTSTGFVNPSATTYHDVRPGYGGGETYDQGYSQGQNYGPQAGDNDADVYDYDADVDYDEVLTDKPVTGTGTSASVVDYATGSGGFRHHRERMTEDGVYQARDVKRRGDGSKHVHREYQNPVTGTRTVRDYEVE